MTPKVSIIIAVGVPGAYIEECISYCLKLNYPDFEIIVLRMKIGRLPTLISV